MRNLNDAVLHIAPQKARRVYPPTRRQRLDLNRAYYVFVAFPLSVPLPVVGNCSRGTTWLRRFGLKVRRGFYSSRVLDGGLTTSELTRRNEAVVDAVCLRRRGLTASDPSPASMMPRHLSAFCYHITVLVFACHARGVDRANRASSFVLSAPDFDTSTTGDLSGEQDFRSATSADLQLTCGCSEVSSYLPPTCDAPADPAIGFSVRGH